MTETDEITTTAAAAGPSGVPVPGWQRPAWAEEFIINGGNYVTFKRTARRIPLVYRDPTPDSEDAELTPHPVSLSRDDELLIGGEATISVRSEPVIVFLDIETLPISQARVLAEALIELADHADD